MQGYTVLGGSGNGGFGASATENFNSGDFPISPFYCLDSDPAADDDEDGVPNYKDADFCSLNNKGVCASMDADGDGIINSFDRDSDNDGIPDLIEAKGVDSNGDGVVDNLTDTDGDGLADSYDNDTTDGPSGSASCSDFPSCLFTESTSSLLDTNGDGTNNEEVDQDYDGLANMIDIDADNDGLPDVIEAGGADTNADGLLDGNTYGDYGFNMAVDPSLGGSALMTTSTDDSDENTRPEFSEGGYSGSIADTDGDDVPDFLDIDSDNDGLYDNYEAQTTASYTAPGSGDSDGDGLLNAYDDSSAFGGKGIDTNNGLAGAQQNDQDADTIPDYRDTDSDDDHVLDRQEIWDGLYDGDSREDNLSNCNNTDTDGDGLADCFDSSSLNAAVYSWAGNPANDNGSTDGGQTTSTGTLFTSGSSLDALLPDNGGNSFSEPDFRDQLIQCGVPKVYYALTEESPTTATDFAYQKISDIHIDGATTNTIRATSFCEPDVEGWCYYFNPLEAENYLFAIRNSSGSPNTVDMADLIDYIEIKTESNPYNRYVMGASGASLVMARDWNVVFKGTPTSGSTFDIKFYFQPDELQELDRLADSLMVVTPSATRYALQWFKKPGGLSNSDISVSGIANDTDITSYATEVFNEATGVAEDGIGRSTDGSGSTPGNGKNYIEFQGLSSFSGGTAMIRIANAPLPVELRDFYAEATGCETMIVWTSESERNFDYYMLERSADGRRFSPIASIQAAGGDHLQAYQYHDRIASIVNYYRLKMIDFDGTFEYSPIISVETDCELAMGHIQLYPNPISYEHQQVNIRLRTRKESVRLLLTNLTGRRIKEAAFAVQPGWNLLSLDISELPAGIYFLTNMAENRKISQRLVITDVY